MIAKPPKMDMYDPRKCVKCGVGLTLYWKVLNTQVLLNFLGCNFEWLFETP